MRVPSETELLGLWESGTARHPIDRALLLCSWGRPDLPADRIASLPLGVVNAVLLRMRETLFGPRVEIQVRCGKCGERLEIGLEIGQLLAGTAEGDERREIDVEGFRFRVPNSRDLASIAGERDPQAAALQLLQRCCVGRPDGGAPSWPAILGDAESQLECVDPIADLRLAVSCEACGHHWDASLDAGVLLWDEVHGYAQRLLREIDSLARAYGWTESEVLALSARRRAAYLGMVGA